MCVLRLHAITSRFMGKQKEIKVPKKFETQAASSMVLTKTRTYFLVGLSLVLYVDRSGCQQNPLSYIYNAVSFFPTTLSLSRFRRLSLEKAVALSEEKFG